VFPKLFELADQETMKKNLADQKVEKKFPRTITSNFLQFYKQNGLKK
jgi:hypothetical protein